MGSTGSTRLTAYSGNVTPEEQEQSMHGKCGTSPAIPLLSRRSLLMRSWTEIMRAHYSFNEAI